MPSVSHRIVADRPIDAVFDVVTTARFWLAWHPATRGVEGMLITQPSWATRSSST